MSLRVVFDTNVLFSAVGWRGNPAKCVEMAISGEIRGVTCTEILEELAEKLTKRLRFNSEEVNVVLASLVGAFDLVSITGTLTGTQSDPKDDKIVECAVVAAATHVVTGDKKHLLPLMEYHGIKIITPARLLQVVKSRARE